MWLPSTGSYLQIKLCPRKQRDSAASAPKSSQSFYGKLTAESAAESFAQNARSYLSLLLMAAAF